MALNPRFAAAANNLASIYSEHGGDQDSARKALQLAVASPELFAGKDEARRVLTEIK